MQQSVQNIEQLRCCVAASLGHDIRLTVGHQSIDIPATATDATLFEEEPAEAPHDADEEPAEAPHSSSKTISHPHFMLADAATGADATEAILTAALNELSYPGLEAWSRRELLTCQIDSRARLAVS